MLGEAFSINSQSCAEFRGSVLEAFGDISLSLRSSRVIQRIQVSYLEIILSGKATMSG